MGQGRYLEAHGGSNYCAVATLYLLGHLNTALTNSQVGCERDLYLCTHLSNFLLYLLDSILLLWSANCMHWQRQRLVRWLVWRQSEGGLQGRPNKPPDTCYTFWVGAALKVSL